MLLCISAGMTVIMRFGVTVSLRMIMFMAMRRTSGVGMFVIMMLCVSMRMRCAVGVGMFVSMMIRGSMGMRCAIGVGMFEPMGVVLASGLPYCYRIIGLSTAAGITHDNSSDSFLYK